MTRNPVETDLLFCWFVTWGPGLGTLWPRGWHVSSLLEAPCWLLARGLLRRIPGFNLEVAWFVTYFNHLEFGQWSDIVNNVNIFQKKISSLHEVLYEWSWWFQSSVNWGITMFDRYLDTLPFHSRHLLYPAPTALFGSLCRQQRATSTCHTTCCHVQKTAKCPTLLDPPRVVSGFFARGP